eukprot:CAMPEP_0173272096 /NCGR_PEP_ID=MMETSP1143-20121109/1174_1 /TAXON_ID=483371 /ORGANISM="non described non described, Strain CCMP2298" /LENGTH=439 /DNA_ID=CAMNT_0014208717 /DNA_START=29 /DNA_END=1346 /DNA_ORIENTATION=-
MSKHSTAPVMLSAASVVVLVEGDGKTPTAPVMASARLVEPSAPPAQGPLTAGDLQLVPSTQVFPRVLEVFENHRYNLRLGFGAKGLLINDRGVFSTCGGESCFVSLKEAEEDHTTPGWKFDSDGEWLLDGEQNQGSSVVGADQGWLYGVDFGGFSQTSPGNPKKGMAHFVRRRRWVRAMAFEAQRVITDDSLTCQHCDAKEVDFFSQALLLHFHIAWCLKYGPKFFNQHKFAKLKTLYIERVLGSLPKNGYCRADLQTNLGKISSSYKSIMSKGVTPLNPKDPDLKPILEQFCLAERKELARVQSANATHATPTTATPVSAVLGVPSHVCCAPTTAGTTSLACSSPQHDASCVFKPVPCTACGGLVSKQEMVMHMQNVCVMRLVQCPYRCIGCLPPVVCRDVEDHCAHTMPLHLQMAMTVVAQQGAEIASLKTQKAQLQ